MGRHVPPWLTHTRDDPERELYAAMSPDERLACFVEVCELARTILEARPNRAEVLKRIDPMSPAAEQTWRNLIRKARDGGYSW